MATYEAMIGARRPGPGMLQFFPGSPDERASLRERFDREHCVLIPAFLGGELLEEITELVDRTSFYRRRHGDIGVEDCMEPGTALALLLLAANDPRLFDTVREVTGCGPIGCFDGRVYRMDPQLDHHDSWHSDLGVDRMIAMSVNLTTESYAGGVLQVRDERSGAVAEVANVGPGDAVLFRISEHLRHRVTAVEGNVPKVAFAGWYKSRPTFAAVLHGASWFAD